MTAAEMQAARDRIDRLIPDGGSVLMGLRRACTAAQWEELREYHHDRLNEFYEGYAAAWEEMSVTDRESVLQKSGFCWSRSKEMSVSAWGKLTPMTKKQVYRWIDRALVSGRT